jgi:hypothetical protein
VVIAKFQLAAGVQMGVYALTFDGANVVFPRRGRYNNVATKGFGVFFGEFRGVLVLQVGPVRLLPVSAHAQGKAVPGLHPGDERGFATAKRTGTDRQGVAWRAIAVMGDDVDHPGHGIGTVQRGGRTKQHFHLFARIQ